MAASCITIDDDDDYDDIRKRKAALSVSERKFDGPSMTSG